MSPQPPSSPAAPEGAAPLLPPTAPVDAGDIRCAACGTLNLPDSKFCRGCGHLLRVPPAPDALKAEEPGNDADADAALTSPAEIDARRSRQLLERAIALSDKGDLSAALIACRQAVALDPSHAPPLSLLGTLLERSGDLRGALVAYEKVAQLTPDSAAAREGIGRLQDRLAKAPAFNFNPEELFASDTETPVAAPLAEVSSERAEGVEARLPPTSAALKEELSAVNAAEANSTAAPVAVPPTKAEKTARVTSLAAALTPELIASAAAEAAAPSVAPAPKVERREVNVPVATERRAPGSNRRATPASALPTPAPVAPLNFSFTPDTPARVPFWAQMLRGPSFFGRTLPLVGVAVLGLGFLSWARSQAVAREAAQPAVVQTGTPTIENANVAINPSPVTITNRQVVPAPASNNNGGGVAITNATPTPAPITAPAINPPAPSAPAPSGGPASTSAAPRRAAAPLKVRSKTADVPPFPLAPAPVPNPTTSGGAGSNGPLILPPPQTGGGGDAPPVIQVGGNPLVPGGGPQTGRIRITQGSIVGRPAPPRSGTKARGDERDAAAAAANGQTDRAIRGLTDAINAPGADQGYLLQQRAMEFLKRGDSSRAVEDFNAAISAYQTQIDRGEGIPAAKAGIRSARAGLNSAMAGG